MSAPDDRIVDTTAGRGRVRRGRALVWTDARIRLLLAAIVLVLYAPSVRYGLIWDDPEWFARTAAARGTAAFGALEGYGFFRPLTVLWHGLFVTPDGRVLDTALHAAQIAWHVGSTLLVFGLARRWLPGRTGAAVAAAIFAMLPFAQQSVAWAGAHQPAALFFTLVALEAWLARAGADAAHRRLGRRPALAVLSLSAYTVALGLHEAAAPLGLAIWLATPRSAAPPAAPPPAASPAAPRPAAPPASIHSASSPGGDRTASDSPPPGPLAVMVGRPPPHVLLAALFVAWRSALPLASEHVGSGMDLRSLGMLLQPVAWPVTRALAYMPPVERVARSEAEAWVAALVVAVAIPTWIAVARWVARRAGPHVAVWASVWIGIAIASAWLGLGWNYVRHAPRLGYTASVGVALLWGALAGVMLDAAHRRDGRSSGGLTGRWFGFAGRRFRLVGHRLGLTGRRFDLAGRRFRLVARRLAFTRRAAAATGIGALLALCAADTLALNRMHAAAASSVEQATTALQRGDALMINMPDRILPRRPPYPLGDWDVIALPVALGVDDFARARFGRSEAIGSEVSRFVPTHGFDEREALPWWVDHRGEAANPATLVELAGDGRAVYATRWAGSRAMPDMRFVGRLLAPSAADRAAAEAHWMPPNGVEAAGFVAANGARSGTAAWPVAADRVDAPGSGLFQEPKQGFGSESRSGSESSSESGSEPGQGRVRESRAQGEIRLRAAALGGILPARTIGDRMAPSPLWLLFERRGAPPPDGVTIFVHVLTTGGELFRTLDGDAWDGLLPPHAWPDGVPLVDGRHLDPAAAFGAAEFRIGFYERDGERLPAHLGDLEGRRAPEDALRIDFGPAEGPGLLDGEARAVQGEP